MFNFPNKTEQKMWNLMRLGLLELQTGKYLVIKEITKKSDEFRAARTKLPSYPHNWSPDHKR